MSRERSPKLWHRRFVIIALVCSTATLIYTATFIYTYARTGRGPDEFLSTWRPAMLVAGMSLLIMALSRSKYLGRLELLEQEYKQEIRDTRSRLVKAAAHELRNPMTGLKGVLAILRRRAEAGRPVEDWIGLIDVADHEINRMADFLNDFVDAFHVQQGHLELKCEPIGMAKVLSNAMQPFLALAEDEGRQLVRRGATLEAVTIMGDAMRLEQVFRNLLSNALKYSPNGTDIIISADILTTKVIIAIQDFGIGISSQDIPHVFDCFYRVKSAAERDPGGTGLGLFISKDIIERHGGQIWAQSVVNTGTTFYVELPVHALTQPAPLYADHARVS